jgi:hypothetical protein
MIGFVMKKYLLIVALLAFIPRMGYAQACCGGMGGMGTAGTRFGLGTAGAKSLQLQLAYDLNYMNGIYDGNVRLEDDDRQRIIHSGILEANYGITRRLSVAGIMTYVGQELASTDLDGYYLPEVILIPDPMTHYSPWMCNQVQDLLMVYSG